jgi:hypothetical protein
MGKSASPDHSRTEHFSITVPSFLQHELKELIGTYGTSLSDVIVHICHAWLTDNEENVDRRLAKYRKYKGTGNRLAGASRPPRSEPGVSKTTD